MSHDHGTSDHEMWHQDLEARVQGWDRQTGEELAGGRLFWVDPAPTDRVDAASLAGTEGERSEAAEGLELMGWRTSGPVVLNVDLGDVEPISGLSLWTGAEKSAGDWPLAILVLVSVDGQSYHLVGDLIDLDVQRRPSPSALQGLHHYATDALQTHGRYLRLVVGPGEERLLIGGLEVFRGEGAWLLDPLEGEPIFDMAALYTAELPARRISRRLRYDVQSLREVARGSDVDPEVLDELEVALASILEALPALHAYRPDPPEDAGLERIGRDTGAAYPVHPLHTHLFETQAMFWRALGLPRLCVQGDRGDGLESPFSVPSSQTGKGEAGASLTLSNAGDSPLRLHLRLLDEAGSSHVRLVALSYAEGSDGTLTEVESVTPRDDGGYLLELPSGVPHRLRLVREGEARPLEAGALRVQLTGEGVRKTVRLNIAA